MALPLLNLNEFSAMKRFQLQIPIVEIFDEIMFDFFDIFDIISRDMLITSVRE